MIAVPSCSSYAIAPLDVLTAERLARHVSFDFVPALPIDTSTRFVIIPAQTLTTTFAAALYLFTGHHALAMMHSVMAAPLLNEHRFHEAAYHLHEALVIWKTIADR